METRANYVMIGSVVLLLVVAIFAFALWVVRIDVHRDVVRYDILFERSIAGLSVGSPVRYKGIDVGQVKKIAIDGRRPDLVRVTVEVARNTPIGQDSVASIESQGFTGVSYILIEGGTSASKPLTVQPGEPYPIIAHRPSPLQELFTDVPSLIAEASLTISKLHKFLSDENLAALTGILQDSHAVTSAVASRSEDLKAALTNFNAMSIEMRTAAASYQTLAETLNSAVDSELKPTLADIASTARALDKMAEELAVVVEQSRGPLTAFTHNTLPEAGQFVSEARRLAATLGRIAERLEHDPSEFFSQNNQPEYNAR